MALTLAMRVARASALAAARPAAAGQPDVDRARHHLEEICKALAYREDVRRHHAAVSNGAANDGAAVDKIVAAVLEAADQLEEALR